MATIINFTTITFQQRPTAFPGIGPRVDRGILPGIGPGICPGIGLISALKV